MGGPLGSVRHAGPVQLLAQQLHDQGERLEQHVREERLAVTRCPGLQHLQAPGSLIVQATQQPQKDQQTCWVEDVRQVPVGAQVAGAPPCGKLRWGELPTGTGTDELDPRRRSPLPAMG